MPKILRLTYFKLARHLRTHQEPTRSDIAAEGLIPDKDQARRLLTDMTVYNSLDLQKNVQ
jgi:hypothetical protein